MTLPASGFGILDIAAEIFGVGTTGKDLAACVASSDPAVASGVLPASVLSFASHTQKWGRGYTYESISLGGWIKRETEGTFYSFGGTDPTLEFTGDRNESIGVYKSGTGTPIVSGDAVRVEIYYRTKQTTDSWTFSIGWNNYASATYGPHACLFTLYDYKFVLTNNI